MTTMTTLKRYLIETYLTESCEENEEEIHEDFVSFFIKNPNPSDEQIHDLADKMKMPPSQLEEKIYSMLSSLLKVIGKHDNVPDTEFDRDELEAGINVEMEHTDNKFVAKMITKDHLSEFPDYYTRLKKMENK